MSDNEDQCAELVCEAQSGNQGVGVALCRDLIGEKEIIVRNGVLKHNIVWHDIFGDFLVNKLPQ